MEPAHPTPASVRRSSRPFVAGVLLLFLFGLAAFQGVAQAVFPIDPETQGLRFEGNTFVVSGVVRGPDGTPVEGAFVASVQQPERNATTDVDGAYAIDGLAAGYNSLNISAEGFPAIEVRVVLLRAQQVDVHLGGSDPVVDHASLAQQRTLARTLGILILGASVVCLAGAVAAYQRKRRGLVVAGCVAGFVGALPLSVVLAPAALIMTLRDRSDWN